MTTSVSNPAVVNARSTHFEMQDVTAGPRAMIDARATRTKCTIARLREKDETVHER
jgi:hypothetical protein